MSAGESRGELTSAQQRTDEQVVDVSAGKSRGKATAGQPSIAEEVVAVSGGGSPAETGRVPLRTNQPAPTKLDNEPLNPKLSGSVGCTTTTSSGLLQTEKESWWGWQESHRAAAWGEQHGRWRESCGSNRCELSRESDGMIRQFHLSVPSPLFCCLGSRRNRVSVSFLSFPTVQHVTLARSAHPTLFHCTSYRRFEIKGSRKSVAYTSQSHPR